MILFKVIDSKSIKDSNLADIEVISQESKAYYNILGDRFVAHDSKSKGIQDAKSKDYDDIQVDDIPQEDIKPIFQKTFQISTSRSLHIPEDEENKLNNDDGFFNLIKRLKKEDEQTKKTKKKSCNFSKGNFNATISSRIHRKTNETLFDDKPPIEENKEDSKRKENIEPDEMQEILKRVFERNKREAEAKNRELFLNSSKHSKRKFSHMNFNSTSNKFFTNTNGFSSNSRQGDKTKEENSKPRQFRVLTLDPLEIIDWKKHEEVWDMVNSYKIPDNLSRYLAPPNESDILLSMYLKHNENFKVNVIHINESVLNPAEEARRWKNTYKKSIVRWHPDKLYPVLDSLNIDTELVNHLKRKCANVLKNINIVFNAIIEGLKAVQIYIDRGK